MNSRLSACWRNRAVFPKVAVPLVKATFTGLVLDLLATGHRKRLTDALECTLRRLDNLTQTAP